MICLDEKERIERTLYQAFEPASKNYIPLTFEEDDLEGLWCNKVGDIDTEHKKRNKGRMKANCIAYMEADGFAISSRKRNLTDFSLYDGNGCYLMPDNFTELLPLWVAKHFPIKKWYEKDFYVTSADGGDAYKEDDAFLKSCLFYTALSEDNHCLSMEIQEGYFYNNLCFDDHASASVTLDMYLMNADTWYTHLEMEMMKKWMEILNLAKEKSEIGKEILYSPYQIRRTFPEEQEIQKGLDDLKPLLEKYYEEAIREKMLQYKLVR